DRDATATATTASSSSSSAASSSDKPGCASIRRLSAARPERGSAERSSARRTRALSIAVIREPSFVEVSRARPTGRFDGRRYPGPMARLRVGVAQINAVVGDLDGNAQRVLAAYDAAVQQGCRLVVFPELVV